MYNSLYLSVSLDVLYHLHESIFRFAIRVSIVSTLLLNFSWYRTLPVLCDSLSKLPLYITFHPFIFVYVQDPKLCTMWLKYSNPRLTQPRLAVHFQVGKCMNSMLNFECDQGMEENGDSWQKWSQKVKYDDHLFMFSAKLSLLQVGIRIFQH